MMNEKHLNWARSHDWGQSAVLINGTIQVTEERELLTFSTFSHLREWAGY